MANYIIRKTGAGRDATAAIVAKSNRAIAGVLKNDVLTRFKGKRIPQSIGYLFRWGYTGDVPAHATVVNEARAIGLTSDKATFRAKLNEKGLSPKAGEEFPCVVRPKYHAQGEHVHLCKTANELQIAKARCGAGAYVSAFIDKVAEYRVFVVSGRVAWVARKTPPNVNPRPVAWNHTFGSVFTNERFDSWPLKVCRTAIEAFNLSGLDFGAVDVMVDKDGKPYVLEINTAIALESEYRATTIAKCFDWITIHGKGMIPLVERRGGYTKFVHPAVCGGALV